MRIEIERIEMHGFMPYEDETFDFGGTKGLNLICGKNLDLKGSKNGTGKTSIALALTYGLFGTLPFRLKNENIVNRYSDDKNMRICLYLKSDDVTYKIARGINRGKSSYCNVFRVDGDSEEDITKSSIAETNLFVEREIIRCDLDLFMRTIYLNSDPSYNFYNLKHSEKKDFIDKIFDISIFGNMYEAIHRDVNRLDKDIVSHQNRLMVLNSSRDDIMDRSSRFEDEKRTRVETLEKDLSSRRSALEKARGKTVERKSGTMERCKAAIEGSNRRISAIGESIRKEESCVSEYLREEKNLKGMISDRRKILDRHRGLMGKLCEDCRKVFADHHGLGRYESEIESLEKKLSVIPEKVERKTKAIGELKAKASEEKDKISTLEIRIAEIERSRNERLKELRDMEVGVSMIEASLERERGSANPYVEMLSENEKSISSENSEISSLQERYRYLKAAEGIVDQENLKKFIIRDLVILLNNRIKFYLHRLGANFDVEFDDEMNYEFKTSSPASPEFNNFSSGEQARISIATCFAFRDFLSTRSSISSNILILDEFIDSNVDSLAIDNTIQLLKEMSSQNGQNIFLVSHRKEIDNSVFDNIIQVEKRGNISRIRLISS